MHNARQSRWLVLLSEYRYPYTFVVYCTRGWVLKKHLSFNKNNIPGCAPLRVNIFTVQTLPMQANLWITLYSTSLLSYHISLPPPLVVLSLLFSLSLFRRATQLSSQPFLGVLHLLSQVYFHSSRRAPPRATGTVHKNGQTPIRRSASVSLAWQVATTIYEKKVKKIKRGIRF